MCLSERVGDEPGWRSRSYMHWKMDPNKSPQYMRIEDRPHISASTKVEEGGCMRLWGAREAMSWSPTRYPFDWRAADAEGASMLPRTPRHRTRAMLRKGLRLVQQIIASIVTVGGRHQGFPPIDICSCLQHYQPPNASQLPMQRLSLSSISNPSRPMH